MFLIPEEVKKKRDKIFRELERAEKKNAEEEKELVERQKKRVAPIRAKLRDLQNCCPHPLESRKDTVCTDCRASL